MGDEKPASRQYSSFLIRCWRLDAEARRIKIEHIQSGRHQQVDTLAAALAWMDAHMTEVAATQRAASVSGEAQQLDKGN